MPTIVKRIRPSQIVRLKMTIAVIIPLIVRELLKDAKLKAIDDATIPRRVGILEDGERGFACIHLFEIALRGMGSNKLLTKAAHCERATMLEPSHKPIVSTIEQVLAILLEEIFIECFHCYYYAGTVRGCQCRNISVHAM